MSHLILHPRATSTMVVPHCSRCAMACSRWCWTHQFHPRLGVATVVLWLLRVCHQSTHSTQDTATWKGRDHPSRFSINIETGSFSYTLRPRLLFSILELPRSLKCFSYRYFLGLTCAYPSVCFLSFFAILYRFVALLCYCIRVFYL